MRLPALAIALLLVSFHAASTPFSTAAIYERLNQAIEDNDKLILESNARFCRSTTADKCKQRIEENERTRARMKAEAVREFQEDERKLEAGDCESMSSFSLFATECHRRKVEKAQRSVDEAERKLRAIQTERTQLEALQEAIRKADERYERSMDRLKVLLGPPVYVSPLIQQPQIQPRLYPLPQSPTINCRSWFDGYYTRTDCN